jgi:hypothetical protein
MQTSKIINSTKRKPSVLKKHSKVTNSTPVVNTLPKIFGNYSEEDKKLFTESVLFLKKILVWRSKNHNFKKEVLKLYKKHAKTKVDFNEDDIQVQNAMPGPVTCNSRFCTRMTGPGELFCKTCHNYTMLKAVMNCIIVGEVADIDTLPHFVEIQTRIEPLHEILLWSGILCVLTFASSAVIVADIGNKKINMEDIITCSYFMPIVILMTKASAMRTLHNLDHYPESFDFILFWKKAMLENPDDFTKRLIEKNKDNVII